MRILGATIMPFGSSTVPGVVTPENEAKRQAVNRWIRTGGAFDAVVDFDAAVRDPANPARLAPAYDFDGLHLTDAGLRSAGERDQSIAALLIVSHLPVV